VSNRRVSYNILQFFNTFNMFLDGSQLEVMFLFLAISTLLTWHNIYEGHRPNKIQSL